MNCIICRQGCFIGHHVCYDPEISVPICDNCHQKIHHGEYFYLDPTRMARNRHHELMSVSSDNYGGARLVNTATGEIEANIPYQLVKYTRYAMQSRAFNRYQMEQRKR